MAIMPNGLDTASCGGRSSRRPRTQVPSRTNFRDFTRLPSGVVWDYLFIVLIEDRVVRISEIPAVLYHRGQRVSDVTEWCRRNERHLPAMRAGEILSGLPLLAIARGIWPD